MHRAHANLLNDLRTNQEFLLTVLDQPIAFHRAHKKITGSVTAALALSYATQITDTIEPASGGWFLYDSDSWEEETGLTPKEQLAARRHLKTLGLLSERSQSMPESVPERLELKVNFQRIAELLHDYAKTLPTSNRQAGSRTDNIYVA